MLIFMKSISKISSSSINVLNDLTIALFLVLPSLLSKRLAEAPRSDIDVIPSKSESAIL